MPPTTEGVDKMGLDEVRNALALHKYAAQLPAHLRNVEHMRFMETTGGRHFVPATLDAAAEAMPPGWVWEKFDGSFWAWIPGVHNSGPECRVEITDDEKADRFRLALKCLIAMGNAQ